jgi:hypothetical protein
MQHTYTNEFIEFIIRKCLSEYPLGTTKNISQYLAYKLNISIAEIDYYLSIVNYKNDFKYLL